jgi:hypothetical protein
MYVAQAVDCLTRLYDGLLLADDDVTFSLRIIGTNGRLLVSSGPRAMPFFVKYICRIPEITVVRQFPLADWRAGLVDHSIAMAGDIYQRFNWSEPNLEAARTAVVKMFARQW